MKPLRLYIAIWLGCWVMFHPAYGSSPGRHTSSEFAGLVVSIDRLAGEVVAIEGLLYDERFIKLANEGSKNIDAGIQFLSDQGHTSQQRTIAILSMHKLSIEEYVVFLRELERLFDKKLVSGVELGLAVVPSYAFSTDLIENFEKEGVRSILKEIATRNDIRPATKSAIERILSGKAVDDLRSFRMNCCSAPSKAR